MELNYAKYGFPKNALLCWVFIDLITIECYIHNHMN